MKTKLSPQRLQFIKFWAEAQHARVNQMYGGIPYKYHLEKVTFAAYEFSHLLYEEGDSKEECSKLNDFLTAAAYLHDTIEDTGVTYNDVKQIAGGELADLVYALTNEKGKNRAERANDKYYQGIRETEYAVFIKLCDRLANMQFSYMNESTMIEKYRKELPNFLEKLNAEELFPEISERLKGI